MKARDFCYWLQGWIEINNMNDNQPELHPPPNKSQWNIVRQHLQMVFKHEIDPSFGDEKHQELLRQIHEGVTSPKMNC